MHFREENFEPKVQNKLLKQGVGPSLFLSEAQNTSYFDDTAQTVNRSSSILHTFKKFKDF